MPAPGKGHEIKGEPAVDRPGIASPIRLSAAPIWRTGREERREEEEGGREEEGGGGLEIAVRSVENGLYLDLRSSGNKTAGGSSGPLRPPWPRCQMAHGRSWLSAAGTALNTSPTGCHNNASPQMALAVDEGDTQQKVTTGQQDLPQQVLASRDVLAQQVVSGRPRYGSSPHVDRMCSWTESDCPSRRCFLPLTDCMPRPSSGTESNCSSRRCSLPLTDCMS